MLPIPEMLAAWREKRVVPPDVVSDRELGLDIADARANRCPCGPRFGVVPRTIWCIIRVFHGGVRRIKRDGRSARRSRSLGLRGGPLFRLRRRVRSHPVGEPVLAGADGTDPAPPGVSDWARAPLVHPRAANGDGGQGVGFAHHVRDRAQDQRGTPATRRQAVRALQARFRIRPRRGKQGIRRHGGKAILVGHLIPGVGTLVSVPAGLKRIPLRWRFLGYTLLGCTLWNGALISLGWALGGRWRIVEAFTSFVGVAVLILLTSATLLFIWRRRKAHGRAELHEARRQGPQQNDGHHPRRHRQGKATGPEGDEYDGGGRERLG